MTKKGSLPVCAVRVAAAPKDASAQTEAFGRAGKRFNQVASLAGRAVARIIHSRQRDPTLLLVLALFVGV